jgi:hypothetical protein
MRSPCLKPPACLYIKWLMRSAFPGLYGSFAERDRLRLAVLVGK